jgi:Uma2 family endonuclease
MIRTPPVARMSYAEYARAEAKTDKRHEFLNGEVFAMAGGTPEHGALTAAMIRELGTALRGKPRRVYSSDVRVRIEATGLTTYPDASVVCGQRDRRGGSRCHRQPGPRDRGTEPLVEIYRRNAQGRFELIEARLGERLELASVGVTLDVRAIYEDPLTGADATG